MGPILGLTTFNILYTHLAVTARMFDKITQLGRSELKIFLFLFIRTTRLSLAFNLEWLMTFARSCDSAVLRSPITRPHRLR